MSEQKVKIDADKFLSAGYSDMVLRVVANIITNDDQFNALDLVRLFVEALNQENIKSKIANDYLNFYHDNLIKLKYIALPLLEDSEVIGLLTNNFIDQFKIEDYKLLDKFNFKLLNIILISDRDSLKKEILLGLLNNQDNIASDGEIKKISDWLKKYVSVVGLNGHDSLARAQYIISLKNNSNINPAEYKNLIVLFHFFDILSIPADSPEGLIEEPPIVVNGKLCIFRKGILEPVDREKKISEAIRLWSKIDGDTNDNSNIEDGATTKLLDEHSMKQNESFFNLAELEQALTMYPKDSLEHKAVSQEISRLKRSEFKQSQKTDAKL